jgi:hypothetical protein
MVHFFLLIFVFLLKPQNRESDRTCIMAFLLYFFMGGKAADGKLCFFKMECSIKKAAVPGNEAAAFSDLQNR